MQCQLGNKKAMELLVQRWHGRFCKQAYWYTNDIEVSKDVAQDSWSKILQKIHSLKDPNKFGSWALTIVTRCAIDWQRKHKKEQENINFYQKVNTSSQAHQDNDDMVFILLKKSIKELPKNQQIVLHLFYIEEYSIKQISKIMDVSTGTIKSRLFNAREKLKLILKKQKL
ncbi:sigma-70 family RNA polymerase sigma factor [Aquimarina mytili]